MRHGVGTMIYPDGTKYAGTWSFNQPSKEGKIAYQNGDFYDGGWAMNVFCGYGVLNQEKQG